MKASVTRDRLNSEYTDNTGLVKTLFVCIMANTYAFAFAAFIGSKHPPELNKIVVKKDDRSDQFILKFNKAGNLSACLSTTK